MQPTGDALADSQDSPTASRSTAGKMDCFLLYVCAVHVACKLQRLRSSWTRSMRFIPPRSGSGSLGSSSMRSRLASSHEPPSPPSNASGHHRSIRTGLQRQTSPSVSLRSERGWSCLVSSRHSRVTTSRAIRAGRNEPPISGGRSRGSVMGRSLDATSLGFLSTVVVRIPRRHCLEAGT